MSVRIVGFLVIASLLVGCGSGQPQYTEVRLPSGKVVKVLGTGMLHFSQDDPALMLKYQTERSLDEKVALQQEVNEIWANFRFDADRANVKNAVIAANEPPQGRFITSNRSFNFVFKKSPDGVWKQQ
jgi:hypothetical protein